MMDKLNFLIGSWFLKYTIPKSIFSEKATGEDQGRQYYSENVSSDW